MDQISAVISSSISICGVEVIALIEVAFIKLAYDKSEGGLGGVRRPSNFYFKKMRQRTRYGGERL